MRENATKIINARLTPTEYEMYELKASSLGMTLTCYVRTAMLYARGKLPAMPRYPYDKFLSEGEVKTCGAGAPLEFAECE